MVLRDYQIDLSANLRTVCTGLPRPIRVILQAATGSGKSIIAMDLVEKCASKGKRALFIARGRHLVDQFKRHLIHHGIASGVLMSGSGHNLSASVQIASKDTLASWCLRKQTMSLPPADLVIIDEAHESLSGEWVKLIAAYPDAVVIGMTATPARGNGSGLGGLYKAMVQAIPRQDLIAKGWLVPTRCFAPYRPDLKGVDTGSDGDWVAGQLSKRMNKATLVGDVVGWWKKLGQGRQTIVNACTKDHAEHLRDQFVHAGLKFTLLHDEVPKSQQEEMLARIVDGSINGIVNVAILKQGIDLPPVSCCVLARPTKSVVLFHQQIGRVTRPYPGKHDAIVIDHAGAVYLHGMPDFEPPWSLDPNDTIQDNLSKAKKDGKIPDLMECQVCHYMYLAETPFCPSCGHKSIVPRKASKPVKGANGQLVQVDGVATPYAKEEKQRYWRKCLGVMANKGRHIITARAMYYSKFKEWPNGLSPPSPPDIWYTPVTNVYPNFSRKS